MRLILMLRLICLTLIIFHRIKGEEDSKEEDIKLETFVPPMKYYSQFKQDEQLNIHFFRNFTGGIFVDVGAFDGIEGSNTYFFEESLGWKGLNIEPNPITFKQLEQNRPKAFNFNAAIDMVTGVSAFYQNTGYTSTLSGLVKYYHAEHLNRLLEENRQHHGQTELIQVPTVPLSAIFEYLNITRVHYLSIDTEGAELSVLKSIDFTAVFIDVISYEAHNFDMTKEAEIEWFLFDIGYGEVQLEKETSTVDGSSKPIDRVYIHFGSDFIPKHARVINQDGDIFVDKQGDYYKISGALPKDNPTEKIDDHNQAIRSID